MKATQELIDEHKVIERLIHVLDKAVEVLESGYEISPQVFLDASEFISGFADGCHHRKEEGVLFKSMGLAGMPEDSGPIAVMLHEHAMGRNFNREMFAAAQKLAAGDASEKINIIENGRNYSRLLTQHIIKEDTILFPMADRVIPLSLHDQVYEDFEKVEKEETGEGVHEKYLALLEKMEAVYG